MQDIAVLSEVLQRELGYPSGTLYEGIAMDDAYRLWLSKSFDKKFLPDDTTFADAACLELFLERNARCADAVLKPQSALEEEVVEGVKKLFYDLTFTGPDYHFGIEDISSSLGVGPGASIGAVSNDFYSKVFGGPISCTNPTLYTLYKRALESHVTWQSAENRRAATFMVDKCVGSRLSFVPKTSKISRGICTEPSLNMLFQKGIGACIEEGLKRVFNIDLSKQPQINRSMAQIGSLDGSFATIDLSSASDSMSLRVLKEVCPLEFWRWISVARSPFVILPSGEILELHMVSSMGNGFTFPLQTYLFASIVVSAYRALSMKAMRGGRPNGWAVFGDDIIVRNDTYEVIVRCLELFGFIVNGEKSFKDGGFRESCGGDFLRGTDIRGVYLTSLKHDADVYSAINRLVRWSAKTGILIPETIACLVSMLKRKVPLYVPYLAGDAEGVKVPEPLGGEIKVAKTGALLYKALVQVTTSFPLPHDEASSTYYPVKNGRRTKVFFNPDGLVTASIAGFMRDGRVSLRTIDDCTFKVRTRSTSNWSSVITPPDAQLWLKHLTALDQGMGCSPEPYLYGPGTPGYLFSQGCSWYLAAAAYTSVWA